MEEFQSTVQYFGEDTKKITTTDLFGVFSEFITKFEVTLLVFTSTSCLFLLFTCTYFYFLIGMHFENGRICMFCHFLFDFIVT